MAYVSEMNFSQSCAFIVLVCGRKFSFLRFEFDLFIVNFSCDELPGMVVRLVWFMFWRVMRKIWECGTIRFNGWFRLKNCSLFFVFYLLFGKEEWLGGCTNRLDLDASMRTCIFTILFCKQNLTCSTTRRGKNLELYGSFFESFTVA